jgi:hypothetical protein
LKNVSRKIFGNKKDEISEQFSTLHKEKLSDDSSFSIVTIVDTLKDRWARHVARMEESLVKRPLGRLGWRWENNIKKIIFESGKYISNMSRSGILCQRY